MNYELIPCESKETETISFDEIEATLQIIAVSPLGLNSETLTTNKITDWLESDKQNEGFEMFNDGQIISNVTAVKKGVDDDVEESVLDLKPTTSQELRINVIKVLRMVKNTREDKCNAGLTCL